MNRPVALVTGGTSGIGLETARALRSAGCHVYTLSRRGAEPGDARHFSVDVTDEKALEEAVQSLIRQEGRLDIVVNCAGFGISGAVEFTETEEARRQFEVNFFGMVNVNKAVIPYMRRQGGGRIVNISSVAAPVAIPFQTYYSASKAAINAYTLALANELRPFGITVCALMPGDIATGFTDARAKSIQGDEVYGGRIGRSVSRMEKDERGGMSAAVAGAYVAKTALKKRSKPLLSIGFSYKAVCCLAKILPCRLANWVVGKLYAG